MVISVAARAAQRGASLIRSPCALERAARSNEMPRIVRDAPRLAAPPASSPPVAVHRRQLPLGRRHRAAALCVCRATTPREIARAIEDAPWRGGLEPAANAPWTAAEVVSGRIPAELAGTLYRAGPGRIRLGATKYAHWFDGDGYVTAIEMDADANTARCAGKYVETARWTKQRARDGGDGTNDDAVGSSGVAVRGAWTQASGMMANLGRFPTNPSNTSIIVHAGKVLACCEGGAPVAIDPASLATRGEVVFGPSLPMGFSAHSKQDPRDGTLYTWGLKKPPFIGISVGKVNAAGEVMQVADMPFPRAAPEFALLHDCAMSENYLTFFMCPWELPNDAIVGALSGMKSFGHSFKWSDERETWMVVLRKSDLSVVHAKNVPSFSSYHTCDAYEENGKLKVLYGKLRGDRTGLEKNFGDMYAAVWSSRHYNDLHEMTIDIATGNVTDALAMPTNADGERDMTKMIGMEFPVVSPRTMSRRKPKYVYTLANSCGEHGYFDSIQKLNLETQKAETRLSALGHYPHECEFIPKTNADDEDAGYLAYVEYDVSRDAANVVVLDAQRFTEVDPVAVIALPMHVPYTFHGTFARRA